MRIRKYIHTKRIRKIIRPGTWHKVFNASGDAIDLPKAYTYVKVWDVRSHVTCAIFSRSECLTECLAIYASFVFRADGSAVELDPNEESWYCLQRGWTVKPVTKKELELIKNKLMVHRL